MVRRFADRNWPISARVPLSPSVRCRGVRELRLVRPLVRPVPFLVVRDVENGTSDRRMLYMEVLLAEHSVESQECLGSGFRRVLGHSAGRRRFRRLRSRNSRA